MKNSPFLERVFCPWWNKCEGYRETQNRCLQNKKAQLTSPKGSNVSALNVCTSHRSSNKKEKKNLDREKKEDNMEQEKIISLIICSRQMT
uniref:Endoplasmic reticulum-Golgi intermediate compartment protein 3 n=1 Tax=Rhizophora mucronata TaxID=61149 RepID=A0A2P2K297_RHIMU